MGSVPLFPFARLGRLAVLPLDAPEVPLEHGDARAVDEDVGEAAPVLLPDALEQRWNFAASSELSRTISLIVSGEMRKPCAFSNSWAASS